MKYSKIFWVLALVAILCLPLAVRPTPAAAAARVIVLEPDEGEIGEYFTVKGYGFPTTDCPTSCRQIAVDIYFSSDEAVAGEEIDDEVTIYEILETTVEVSPDGKFEQRVQVPPQLTYGGVEDVQRGPYYVYVTYVPFSGSASQLIKAVAEFTVTQAEIELDIGAGTANTKVEITCLGFADEENITVKYDDEDITNEIVNDYADETDEDGEFTSAVLIPESTAGEHTITVSDGTGAEASAIFITEPKIAISPKQGVVGDSMEIAGTGFGKEVAVTITFDGKNIATAETNEHGSFATSFNVPDVEKGSYEVKVEDEDSNSSEMEFTVYLITRASINPYTSPTSPGHVGMDIAVDGIGFTANQEITITYSSEPIVVATTFSDASGAFSTTFKAPQSEPGEHIITANDGINTLAVPFFMESEVPHKPALILPEDTSRAKAETYFNWEDVTDDSLPVTYTLQIATDENFTPDSIVLQEEGLTSSEYTITKQEELEPRKKEAPYYWRVKAIDSAYNESEWSTPVSFYIGGSFWPSWVIYVMWGLGIIGAILFGYRRGKRRAYYY